MHLADSLQHQMNDKIKPAWSLQSIMIFSSSLAVVNLQIKLEVILFWDANTKWRQLWIEYAITTMR